MRRFVVRGAIPLIAAAALVVWAAGASYAGDCYWQHDPSTRGDWLDPSNWDPSTPTSSDTAIIDNAGTASITGGSVAVLNIVSGKSLAGGITQIGGVTTAGYGVFLGHDAGAMGAYNLGGGLLGSQDVSVGYLGTGSFRQSGGVNAIGEVLSLGERTGSRGTYVLSGGQLTCPDEYVGRSGDGCFVQSGGEHIVGGTLTLANDAHVSGSYLLSGGSLAAGKLYVGSNGPGVFAQSGGTNASISLDVKADADWTGAYCLSGGLLATGGQGVTGRFVQSGGTNAPGNLYVESDAVGTGEYHLSGGVVNVLDEWTNGRFNQSGGVHTVRYLHVAVSSGELWFLTRSKGSYDLAGGLLHSQSTSIGALGGTGNFTQSGGTHTVEGFLGLGDVGRGAMGTYILTGGSVASTVLRIGAMEKGVFVQSGGTNTARNVQVGAGSSSPGGTYTLAGGVLACETMGVENGLFSQSGGVNAVGSILSLRGTYHLSGGSLDVAFGRVDIWSDEAAFIGEAGSVVAGTLHMDGAMSMRAAASATVGTLAVSSTSSRLSFELIRAGAAFIRGDLSPTSVATIRWGGHTLDLQCADYRPREGDAFCVLRGFGSITGAFDHVTTDITGGQQIDPNTALPLPLFAQSIVTDPNDAARVALEVVFRGLTAGDASGNHKVDGGDLALMGGAWMMSGQTWATGDFNGDPNGLVDGGDLALMAGNWMWALPPPSPPGAPLPEPTVTILLGAGLALIAARRRNRHGVLGRIRRPEALTAGGFGDTL